MWIFTPFGFLSVVTDRDNHNRLLVRTRARKDLDDFRKNYCRRLGPTIDKKALGRGADYPFRAFVGKKAFANAMRRVIADMTYGNFKSSVKDNTRHNVYMSVWSTMSNAQRAGKLDGTYRAPSYKSYASWDDDVKLGDLAGSGSGKQGDLFGTWKPKSSSTSSSAPTNDELMSMGYTQEQIEDPFYVSGDRRADEEEDDFEDPDAPEAEGYYWNGDEYVHEDDPDPDPTPSVVEVKPPEPAAVQLDNLWAIATDVYGKWDEGEGPAENAMLAAACRDYLASLETGDDEADATA
jgi:hypothetical protein